MNEHFLPLKQGCDPTEAKRHAEVVVPFAGKMKLDESLVIALPSFCKKLPSERGAFDEMIIEQLEAQVNNKIAALVNLVTDRDKFKTEHDAAVEAAQKDSNVAMDQQNQCLADLEAGKSSEVEATTALEAAKAVLSAFESDCKQATDVVNEDRAALSSFVSHNVAIFERLRDQKAPEVTAIEVADDVPPVEGQS